MPMSICFQDIKKITSCLLGLAVVALTSCDAVSEDDRYIEMEPVKAQRVVLLEEFTGQNCPNCPTAHRTIEALQEQYGDAVIPVSIHAGGFAYPEGEFGEYFQTFKTPEGDQYAEMWGVQSYPSGIVDRTSGVRLHTDWPTLVYNELQRPTPLSLTASAFLKDGEIEITATLLSTQDLQGKFQLWVLEDSIVSVQTDGKNVLTDYVHNNVYRASVNGVGGETVSIRGSVYSHVTASTPLRDSWDARHLSIVAFVYDDQGVMQAYRTPLTEITE